MWWFRFVVLGIAAVAFPRVVSAQLAIEPEAFKLHDDIEFARFDDDPLLLDVYVPKRAVTEDEVEKLPCVVWIHGGAWRAGTKARPPMRWLMRHGYVVASIEYRLSGQAIFPAQIHDCKGAVRWLRANATRFRIDPERIGVAGSSAGGHLVALLGTSGDVKELEGETGGNLDQSSRVQAVLDQFGPTDFTLMNTHALPRSPIDHDAANSPESRLIGGPVQENKEKAAAANPITYVTADDPPLLIMHGDRDLLVPHHQSELLVEAYRKASLNVKLHTVAGAGHGWRSNRELDGMIQEFFDRHLKAK